LSRPQAKLARLVSILRSLYFQGHVAGAVVIRKRVSRPKVLEYFGELPPCLIGSMRVRQSTTAARGVSGPAESDSIGGCPYPITV